MVHSPFTRLQIAWEHAVQIKSRAKGLWTQNLVCSCHPLIRYIQVSRIGMMSLSSDTIFFSHKTKNWGKSFTTGSKLITVVLFASSQESWKLKYAFYDISCSAVGVLEVCKKGRRCSRTRKRVHKFSHIHIHNNSTTRMKFLFGLLQAVWELRKRRSTGKKKDNNNTVYTTVF